MSTPSLMKAATKSKQKPAKSLVPVVKKVAVNCSKLRSTKPRKTKSPSPKKVNSSPSKMNRRASKKKSVKSSNLSAPRKENDVRTSGIKRTASSNSQEVTELAESVSTFAVPVRKRKVRPRPDPAASKKRKIEEMGDSSTRDIVNDDGSHAVLGNINTAPMGSAIGDTRTCTTEDKRGALVASDDIKSSLNHFSLTHQKPSPGICVLASDSKDVPAIEASHDPQAGIEDVDYGNVEVEYPEPSTPQQKMMRQLARQKQLEDMRVRETALAREERYQRRHGLACPQPSKSSGSRSKRVQWKNKSDLVKIFIYSAVSDSQDMESDVLPS